MVLWLETRSIWPFTVLPAAVGLRDPVDGAEDDDEDGGHEREAHQVHAVHHEQRVAPIQGLSRPGDFSRFSLFRHPHCLEAIASSTNLSHLKG